MNKIIALLVLFFASSVSGQTQSFVENVLKYENGRNDYFIPIRVKLKEFSGQIVVPSYALFEYLKSTQRIGDGDYAKYVLELQKNDARLDMSDVLIDDSGVFLVGKGIKDRVFRIVKPVPEFKNLVTVEDCEKLIRRYFAPTLDKLSSGAHSCPGSVAINGKDLLLKPRFDLSEQNNVILALFRFEIPLSVDDISGSLKISHSILNQD